MPLTLELSMPMSSSAAPDLTLVGSFYPPPLFFLFLDLGRGGLLSRVMDGREEEEGA